MNFFSKIFGSSGLSLPVTFFLFLFALLMVIVIPNYSNIQEKLGFDTKNSLQKQVVEDQAVILDLKHANDINTDLLNKNEESHQAGLDAVTDHSTKVVENQKYVENVKRVTKQKVIQAEKTPSPDKSSSEAEAEIQITAVWDVYCKFNKDNECSPNS